MTGTSDLMQRILIRILATYRTAEVKFVISDDPDWSIRIDVNIEGRLFSHTLTLPEERDDEQDHYVINDLMIAFEHALPRMGID